MNIGIVFYSFSGYTLSVTDKLLQKLTAEGLKAKREPLEIVGKLKLTALKAELKSIPSVKEFDALVIASPTHGGRLASPLTTFFEEVSSLKGKKVVLLVTHFLPYAMGAKQTIQLMNKASQEKGAQVIGEVHIPMFSFRLARQLTKVVELLKV